jgi:tetratricopeptide (TPR) repeat protein
MNKIKPHIKDGWMPRLYLIPLLILSLMAVFIPGFSQTNDSLFRIANQAYKAGNFIQAAEIYTDIQASGNSSPAMCYNLGNCYYKLHKTGLAILQYERALKMDPRNKDILYNLELTRALTHDNFPPTRNLFIVQWWQSASSFAGATLWLIIHCTFFLLFLFSAGFFLLKREPLIKKRWFRMIIISLLLSLVSLGLGIQRHYDRFIRQEAIITTESCTMMSGPGEGSSVLSDFHEGTKLEILHQQSGWYEVRTPDNHTGWIPASDAEKI